MVLILAESGFAGEKTQLVDNLRCSLKILAPLLDFRDSPKRQGVAELGLEALGFEFDFLQLLIIRQCDLLLTSRANLGPLKVQNQAINCASFRGRGHSLMHFGLLS